MAWAIVSGGFDPLHAGHVALIAAAARRGAVIVLLNSDDWLSRKKGRPFMSWSERAAVVGAMRGVGAVEAVDDADGSVCAGLRELARWYEGPIVFCNGGDRVQGNTPEIAACADLGIEMAWGVGGGKTGSSSDFLRAWREA